MKKIDVNADNPLFYSYLMGDFNSFSKHVKSGVNINCINEENYSLISLVVKNIHKHKNNKKFFDLLISKGVSLKQIGWEKDLLTTCVIHQKDMYYAKELLKNNVNINSVGITCSYEKYGDEEYEEGWSFVQDGIIKIPYGPPIFEALKAGKIDYFELFLKNNASLETFDSYGDSILHFLLLGYGSNLFDHATDMKIFNTLLDNGADIHIRNDNGFDVLNLLVDSTKKDFFEFLFKKIKNINVNSRDRFGRTPLINSGVCCSSLSFAKILIKQGANLDIYDVYNNNALMVSVDFDNIKLFKLLVNSGANVKSVNKLGDNIMHFIANTNFDSNSKKYCEIILKNNPELLTEKNHSGVSALDILKEFGNYKNDNKKFFDKFIKKAKKQKTKISSNEFCIV